MRVDSYPTIALLALFTAGCGTINHVPKDYDLDEPWPTVRTNRPVVIRAGDAPAGSFTIDLAGLSMAVDLQEYTEALVQRVKQALSSQGVAVEQDAATTIEIEVVYANILPHIKNHCVIDFTVRTGNGYVRGHQVRDESGNPEKACNAALSRAALELLSDQQIQSYLAGSS